MSREIISQTIFTRAYLCGNTSIGASQVFANPE
ncbi:MAG: hypothetical protein RJB03_1557 [Bacteroidota bacterium]|jgi:hypothetical protein